MDKTKEDKIDSLAAEYGVPSEDFCIYRHPNKEWYVSVMGGDNQDKRDLFRDACFGAIR